MKFILSAAERRHGVARGVSPWTGQENGLLAAERRHLGTRRSVAAPRLGSFSYLSQGLTPLAIAFRRSAASKPTNRKRVGVLSSTLLNSCEKDES